MPPGLRRIQKPKPPKERKGLDDLQHKRAIRQMRCLLYGKRCIIGSWRGVYPNKGWVEQEYQHQCLYDNGQSDPHHTVKKSHRGHDHSVVPLCRAGHDDAERLGNEGFKKRWGIALPVVASKLAPRK